MLYLGIDIGTTNAKAVLVSDDLRIAAEGSVPYQLDVLGNGGVEQNPYDWQNAVGLLISRFRSEGIDPGSIAGVAISGHGCALVVTDGLGRPLRPAISSLDTRCKAQTERIRQSAGDVVACINGNGVGAFNFEPKLLWLKETEAAHYRTMPAFLSPTSYMVRWLTGRTVMNVSDGGIAMAYDRLTGAGWSDRVVEAIGLDRDKYPEITGCADIVGTVSAAASSETGLPAGIPVIAGGEDTSSAALSLGVTKPGMAFVSLGTQGVVGVCTDRFAVRTELLGFPHVVEGCHLLCGSMSSVGAGMQWFIREWCGDLLQDRPEPGRTVHDRLEDECAGTPPGAGGLLFLPYLSGELHPVLDERAAGVFFGLKLEHTRAHMARAVMEGTAHAIRHNLDFARRSVGPVDRLKAVGGPTGSRLWCQAIADVTGCGVTVAGSRKGAVGAPLGNALLLMNRLAGIDWSESLSALLTDEVAYEPSAAAKAMYDDHHAVYIELYNRVKELFPAMQRTS
ncbi:FGGY-family carbohydrate kinase [Paenibacillus hodogayensis]|uniref:FGGY-family carbohydrate kinase n=1 Tax=Paenibacillus hodogayensis TaxID=279208 RepID=A0ABV5VXV0_9BACL